MNAKWQRRRRNRLRTGDILTLAIVEQHRRIRTARHLTYYCQGYGMLAEIRPEWNRQATARSRVGACPCSVGKNLSLLHWSGELPRPWKVARG